jgi:hypothetical protein
MTKKPEDNTVGPWAKEKLEALGQYLSFYTTVLKKQGDWLRGTIFVDAFAGPGLFRVRAKEKAAEPAERDRRPVGAAKRGLASGALKAALAVVDGTSTVTSPRQYYVRTHMAFRA